MAFARKMHQDLLKEIEAQKRQEDDIAAKVVPHNLPEDFLDGPAPNITRSDIDFTKAGLPEYDGHWAVVLDGALTQEECDQLLGAVETTSSGKWERAMVNIGGGMQAMYEDTRKCGRIILDDRDVAAKILARVKDSVPEIHRLQDWGVVMGSGPLRRNETWKMTRLNERMRFLKYEGGEYFKPHGDGAYETPDRTERSYFTLHLYLNNAESDDGQLLLKGGATTFHSWNLEKRIDVVPKSGRVLLFQQRDLLHSGEDVEFGLKLTMRSDVMYTIEKEETA
ncbi:oxidoreductase domain-containing protein [Dothidotthia symphoricarpi CBS 119687]|uniref:Oxidoreductase domain-containing protein n=1 Tax=Dothidotthia symphoricarpi CBS 119687 TaxID=1392245 RepID=A0A6A6AB17_9PLEO|nr:oxidoreductase domain-containing protein [Dothidotthia symphoricarpi CBS 119687]KAF2128068.1 oxidoreductase domain-containing protein [Dothidotthia symphoricarpi CBS 119687]